MPFKTCIYCIFAVLVAVTIGQNPWQEESQQLFQHYGSMPKGVILEGEATGFEKITTIKYEVAGNRFILNKSAYYPCPIPRTQIAAVLIALSRDSRLGVSLVNKKSIIYGALRPDGETARDLVKADKLLASIIFGWTENLKGIKLPGDFQPKKTQRRQIPAVSINKFKDYHFAKRDNIYYLEKMKMVNILLPLGAGSAQDGGYLPGDKMNLLSAADLDNLDEIKNHSRAYTQIPEITKAAKIGEFAAFARYLQASGNLNLAQLAQHVARSY